MMSPSPTNSALRATLSRLGVCLVCAIVVLGCPSQPQVPETPLIGVGATQRGLGGGQTVSLLVRGFWVTSEPQPSGYGAYAYLLLDRTNQDELRSIARSYLWMYSNVARVDGGRASPSLAVLLAPIRSQRTWPELEPGVAPPDDVVDAFLSAYDYDYATRLTNAVSRTTTIALPAVVASERALEPQRPSVDPLLVRHVGGLSASDVTKQFKGFERDMYRSHDDTEHPAITWLRAAVTKLGAAVGTLPAAVGG